MNFYLNSFRHFEEEEMVKVVDGNPVRIHDNDPIVVGHLERVQLLVAALVVLVGQVRRQGVELTKFATFPLPSVEHVPRPVRFGGIGHVLKIFGRENQNIVGVEMYAVAWKNDRIDRLVVVIILKNGPFPASFFFVFVFSTVNSRNVGYKIWPIWSGFNPRTSVIGSDHSTD